MAFSYGFFNASGGDRSYSATDFNEYFKGIISNGVFPNDANTSLKVTASTSGNIPAVMIQPGKAFYDGMWFYNSTEYELDLGTASQGNYHLVYLCFDTDARTVTLGRVNPTANPVLPSNTATKFYLALGKALDAGASQPSSITDLRTTAPQTAAGVYSSTVDTGQLVDSSVTPEKIEDLAVTAGKLATDAVTSTKIASGAVTLGKLGTSAVVEDNIADNAVTMAKLAAAFYRGTDVATGTLQTIAADTWYDCDGLSYTFTPETNCYAIVWGHFVIYNTAGEASNTWVGFKEVAGNSAPTYAAYYYNLANSGYATIPVLAIISLTGGTAYTIRGKMMSSTASGTMTCTSNSYMHVFTIPR